MYESFKYIYKLTGGAQNQFFSRFTIMVRSMKTEYLLSMIVLVMKEIIVCCVESLLVSHTSILHKYWFQQTCIAQNDKLSIWKENRKTTLSDHQLREQQNYMIKSLRQTS
jgi:hypothetical protein